MAFSEKLRSLRKKSGLSQEQLAEHLNVSRQAVSKWESGISTPESDKLIAIGEYFGVSIDYLLKGGDASLTESAERSNPPKAGGRAAWLLGLISCTVGIISLIVWGIVSVVNPTVSERVDESSAIRIDGNGIFLLICLGITVLGAVLLLKNTKK